MVEKVCLIWRPDIGQTEGRCSRAESAAKRANALFIGIFRRTAGPATQPAYAAGPALRYRAAAVPPSEDLRVHDRR